jgi:hypothetical protein
MKVFMWGLLNLFGHSENCFSCLCTTIFIDKVEEPIWLEISDCSY